MIHMGITTMIIKNRQAEKTLRRSRRGKKGFSLGETMVALFIIALLTLSLATGTAFGVQQYRRAVTRSDARILCSTVSAILSDEFSNATKVNNASVTSYSSRRYGDNISLKVKTPGADGNMTDSTTGFGYLFAGDSELLSKAAYSPGVQDLYVRTPVVQFDGSRIHVEFAVVDSENHPLVETEFDVIPLNELNIG